MCAAMLYTDPRLWVVAASSLAFAMVRVVIVPLLAARVKVFPALSPFSQLLFCNTAVSMLHSVLSSLLAISALLTAHSLNDDFVNTWGSFVVAHIAPHLTVAVLTYQAKDFLAQQLHFALAFGGIIFINLLNTHLLFDVRKAYRKDCALPKAPPSPAPATKAF
ncbi:uncharacterized protein IUM83_00241 [Phytophthora cinnamomi]|uniref:uncharacterized protein n=1 Tax=Phytophthora cinnamomi TaxID=4785 RepID=UPI0035596C1D|nr:hypothetical protein IUM83_00241 [Phytophthora cinnamomi]